ncbi:MAG: glucokinase [Asticcacaulis sp.]
MGDYILLSDISHGDYQKLALARPGQRPEATTHYVCRNIDDFKGAINQFLEASQCTGLGGAAISAAGWERNGVTLLPNHGFAIERAEMREFLGVRRLNLVNDFVAKALAIPRLEPEERDQICGGTPCADQLIAVLGPNTGLGQAALAPDGMGNWTAMPCEGGHSDLAASTELEDKVLRALIGRFGHVSRERVLSLPGVGNIWWALAQIEKDGDAAVPGAEEIVARASTGDERSLRAVSLCMGWFAAMAADVALILGARGGVYLTGELLDMMGDLFDPDAFVARYCERGGYDDYVREIPVFKVTARDMEVIGLATLFD